MNLVIHDLSEEEWGRISADYDGWHVVCGGDAIRPCVGCFSCWNRDPGRCTIKDGYENMGYLIHHADEVHVISRYTYGGFSGSVKNVFDRSLGYVLPQFELVGGETHHQKRYDEDKPFTFIFYGHNLSDKEKKSACRYVKAVCANIRGHVKDVIFKECEKMPAVKTVKQIDEVSSGKVILLNGSMRNVTGNSAKLAKALKAQLTEESEIIDLRNYLNDRAALVCLLEEAETLVLCVPLYVDGLPSQVIRLLEEFQSSYEGGPKKVYVLSNMGLYESRQLVNLFSAVRQWCGKMGFAYCGGLGIGAGELLGALMEMFPFRIWPTRNVYAGIRKLASAIDSRKRIKVICAEPYLFPRLLYVFIANTNWNKTARANSIRPKDLYRRL